MLDTSIHNISQMHIFTQHFKCNIIENFTLGNFNHLIDVLIVIIY